MTHINLFKLPPGNRQFDLIYYVKSLYQSIKDGIGLNPGGGGALSIYTGGDVPWHIRQGGF